MKGYLKVKERRRHVRVPAGFPVSYRAVGSSEDHDAQVRDISEGGMLLVTDRRLEPGSDIILYVSLPGDFPRFSFLARVLSSSRSSGVLVYASRVEFPAVDLVHSQAIGRIKSQIG